MQSQLTQARLKELIHYDPETGVFTWRVRANSKVPAGRSAGNSDGRGYVRICVDGVRYAAHRLAWLYVTGGFPENQLDHKNGDRADNRIANLRPATCAENMQNTSLYRNNRTGFQGVTRHRGKYRALIRCNGNQVELGYFDSPQLAHQAYLDAKQRMHHFQPTVRKSSDSEETNT